MGKFHLILMMRQFVASELKDPICHSDECQIGSFSSEATNYSNKVHKLYPQLSSPRISLIECHSTAELVDKYNMMINPHPNYPRIADFSLVEMTISTYQKAAISATYF